MSDTPPRPHRGRVIDTDIRINAHPMDVWRAWAEPEKIANWFVDRAAGVAKAGEVMTWMFDAFNYIIPVPVLEAEPGKTFVTGSGDAPGPSGIPYLMEITISRDNGGETVVRLVNSGFSESADTDEEFQGVVSGWKMALATLKYWLERYPARTREHRLVFTPANYTWAALRPLFCTIEGRRSWLAPELPWNSHVVVDSGTEVLLAWDEFDALLGLKAFRMGPTRMVSLHVSSWPETADRLAVIDKAGALQSAVNRLASLVSRR
jgi:uncharacterized protein YndB with AHSA1/START domain